MASAAKAKGTRFESAIVSYLKSREYGLRPYRPAQAGHLDVGDVHGIEPFVIQAKAHKAFRLAEWLDAARAQAINAGEQFGVVVVKRAYRPVADSYVVMSLSDFTDVLARVRGK
jgi:hypothetical protein